MKSDKLLFLISIILICIAFACTSDNYDEYYASQCNVSDVTYSGSVQPILQNRCVSCHNANFPSGNVRLDNYNLVKIHVDGGELLGSIKHLPGYSPMPQGNKLDDCSIQIIETWINNGALNN